jgi:hypothetical protein
MQSIGTRDASLDFLTRHIKIKQNKKSGSGCTCGVRSKVVVGEITSAIPKNKKAIFASPELFLVMVGPKIVFTNFFNLKLIFLAEISYYHHF